MADIKIITGARGEKAHVIFTSEKGKKFLIDQIAADIVERITVPKDLAKEYSEDLKKIDPTLEIELE